jgi:hypothetical protein
VFAEGIARLADVGALAITEPLYQPSNLPGVVYEFKPNVRGFTWGRTWVETNAFGLRGPEVERVKPAGTFRIGVFGDSVTFGHGVRDAVTYPRVLERMLNRECGNGQKLEVLNFGVPSYNIANIVSSFAEKGIRQDLDMAILAPIVEDYGFHRDHKVDAYGFPVHAATPVKPGLFKNVLRHIRLAYVVRAAYWSLTGAGRSEVRVVYGTGKDADLERATWGRAESELRRFASAAALHDIVAVYADLGPRNTAELERIIEATGLLRIYVAAATDGYTAEELSVSSRDAHPSALHHRIIAEELFEGVRGLIGCGTGGRGSRPRHLQPTA